jgi:hypothetical protein
MRVPAIALLLVAVANGGCPATNSGSCAGINLMGLSCEQRVTSLSDAEQASYCAAWVQLGRDYAFDAVTCGTMSSPLTIESCRAAFAAPYRPSNPLCPWTVGDAFRCQRELYRSLVAQRDRGEACTRWPTIEGCIPEQREPQSEWQYCDPRMNTDAGTLDVDAGR